MNTRFAWFNRIPILYFVALIISILLSVWLDYRDSIINPDGICYLLSAKMFGTATFKEVTHLCPQSQWPFYSIIIYAVAYSTHLSYMVSAYVINGFFSLLSVMTFILIVKELGGTGRILWLAALTILFSHQFNSLRDDIIRDHGFWAFYLLSIYFLLRYFRQPRMIIALSWSISLLVATLFRIEAAIFLLALPFVSWLHFSQSFRQRLNSFFNLNLLTLLILLILGIGLLFYPYSNLKLGRLLEISNQFQHGINLLIERYHIARMALLQHVLTPDAVNDAGLVLLFVWLAWYLVNLIQTLSAVYSALMIYAWYKKVISLSSQAFLVVGAYLSVNVLITLSFLVERSFLSKRYMIALALICMLWVPFALNSLIQTSSHLRHRIILAIVAFCVFISSIGGIIDFGYSKTYIRSAGDWIAKNVPAQAFLYANDYQLMYYSQHFGYDLFERLSSYVQVDTIIDDKWKQYDYLALRLNAKADDRFSLFLKKLPLFPLQTFSNQRGDKVVVYKVSLNTGAEKIKKGEII